MHEPVLVQKPPGHGVPVATSVCVQLPAAQESVVHGFPSLQFIVAQGSSGAQTRLVQVPEQHCLPFVHCEPPP
jgi:hypothetical protein